MVDQRPREVAIPQRQTDGGVLPPRQLELIYLTLLLAGCILPYVHFIPWFIQNGPDVSRFQGEMFETAIGRFFAWDVIVAVIILLVVAKLDPRLARGERLLVAVGALAGASVGLPLYLWLHSRKRRLGEPDRES